MKRDFKRIFRLLAALFSFFLPAVFLVGVTGILAGCSGGEGDDGGGAGAGGLPALSAGDLNATAPCPDQDLLTNATFTADLKEATAFTLVVNETNFPKSVCAMGADFALPDDLFDVLVTLGDFNLNNLLFNDDGAGVGVDVCGDDSSIVSFPKEGVYRRDIKMTANGRSYRFRMRVTLTAGSPDVMGKPMADSGIADLEGDITYVDSAGNPLTIDDSVLSTLADVLPSSSFSVKKTSDDSTLFTALAEMICAQEI